ncbi:MAG: MerR family transcriptional regulator [Planctomycetes bacterium]|nr:MerR family transcriptional regulator [Planctomycetota bacterium]
MKQSWNLDQLGRLVAKALSEGYQPALSGRVRAVPDRRTIRYYTTLGLVDRPSELRGRTAYYGRRHLLQLVAIKRLQGEGFSLREVQQRLAGLDDRSLGTIAAISEQATLASVEAEGGASATLTSGPEMGRASEPVEGRAAFWAARPPVAAPASLVTQGSSVEPLRALGLATGVSLVVPGGPQLQPADIAALARAAEPLLSELSRLGILQDGGNGGPEGPNRSAE